MMGPSVHQLTRDVEHGAVFNGSDANIAKAPLSRWIRALPFSSLVYSDRAVHRTGSGLLGSRSRAGTGAGGAGSRCGSCGFNEGIRISRSPTRTDVHHTASCFRT
jgi:hypothetical protein